MTIFVAKELHEQIWCTVSDGGVLDREVSSGPSSDGKFLIHYRKHPAQKQQEADLGKRDIGAQGARAIGST